jgi:hypothetical protein
MIRGMRDLWLWLGVILGGAVMAWVMAAVALGLMRHGS